MEDYNRSRSYGTGMMQLDTYHGVPPRPSSGYELRSYSVSYSQSQMANRDFKLKKGKSTSASSSKSWSFADPEFQRKKRVASYKMYSVEALSTESCLNGKPCSSVWSVGSPSRFAEIGTLEPCHSHLLQES
ncbi:hypothetical protein Golax_003511 [Gossypium laxum]|uniref:Uncharacterized protein n=1 Tax=Gossypium laxum TaxID=34288 RepID=A0A7J9AG27_9ROSI|nr:hypothetical protein [Gossypium laxum]